MVILAAAELATIALPALRYLVLRPEETAAARGWRLAGALGCFNCHGGDGKGGVRNPSFVLGVEAEARWRPMAEFDDVPALAGEGQPLTADGVEDVREYILDGAPRRKLDDPDYRARIAAAAVRMPSFRRFLSAAQVADLLAFLRAVAVPVQPEDAETAHGAEVAAATSCFGCHGPLGAGGRPNPGSLKGYIPGFWGPDFDELVRDDDELRRWIADGAVARVTQHPIGGYFFGRQAITMPEYGESLPAADIQALVRYVRWLRVNGGRLATAGEGGG